MEGVSEQHIVGFAAGLAQEGFIPYVNTIGTFLTRRSFEQVSIDVGLHRLPVRLLASGGGMVYAPLASKWDAFGFEVTEVNGHDVTQLEQVLGRSTNTYGKPRVVLAYTVKGKGFTSAENTTAWHHKAKITRDEILNLRREMMA